MEIQDKIILACTMLLLSLQSACVYAESKELIIFHAGSLSVPFKAISDAFSKKYPDVVIKAEAAGSRDSARKISDLKRPCDVFGSADEEVVRQLLMPKYSDFNISFASNEMAIAYTAKSRHKKNINAKNWYKILLLDDVAFGRADPDRDPCGYRTLMLFQLAGKHYKQPGLAKKLQDKGGLRFVRPKETDLLALLESGEIDYLFIYRSVIEQHNLKLLRLPDKINLSTSDEAEYYKQASVQIMGTAPGEFVKMTGAPITYSVTIPKNSEDPKLAEAWVSLLLSPEGQKIIKQNGQLPINPPKVNNKKKLPNSLKRYFK